MKTTGIIVEYNPFHNGHQYHLERARRETGADFIIAVMSGDFVQRGEPALTNKHTRTRMALLGGADLVLELPVIFATGSAGDFSAGAVSLLDKLGVVDTLCFGSESGAIEPFLQAAAVLADEPPSFRTQLQRNLRQGLSFPLARSMALQSCLSSPPYDATAASALLPEHFLSSPNNILGLEYCRALCKRKSAIRPVTIQRKGAGYHDDAISGGSNAIAGESGAIPAFSSARAIRLALQRTPEIHRQDIPENNRQNIPEADMQDMLFSALPAAQHPLWHDILREGRLLFPQDLTKELRYRLILEEASGFLQYADLTRELSDKLRKCVLSFSDWNALCEMLKSKEMTYSRISRALCHILLSITQDDLQRARDQDYMPYARILGFRKSAAPLLSAIRKNSAIPLISRLAGAYRLLDADALAILRQNIAASHLYESAMAAKCGTIPQNEYTRQICIL